MASRQVPVNGLINSWQKC